MRRKAVIWILVGACSSVLAFPFLALFGPDRLKEYIHKQLIYKAIVANVTKDAGSQTEIAVRLCGYVQTHMDEPEGEGGPDKHSLDNLIRAHGSCDQQANAVMHLAGKANIKGRLLFLQGAPHSVVDLYLDGAYRILDPYFGIVFTDDKGSIATLEDIRERIEELVSEQMDAIAAYSGYQRAKYYVYFKPGYDPVVFHTNFEFDLPRRMISGVTDTCYDVFGDFFLVPLQDLYFFVSKTGAFEKARLKHLAFRFDSAIEDYKELKEMAKENSALHERVSFFLGQAFWDKEDYKRCITEFEDLLRKYPDTRFRAGVRFGLGDSCENIGDFERALFHYSVIKDGWETPAPARYKKIMSANGPQ